VRLTAVTIQRFRNFVDPQRIAIEPDVTGLVGKNESGKTTILKALHRLNPANGDDWNFNLTIEYPRWRLARDRRDGGLDNVEPVDAKFELDSADIEALAGLLPAPPPMGTLCKAARSYSNEFAVWLECDHAVLVRAVCAETAVRDEDIDELVGSTSIADAQTKAGQKAKELKATGQALPSQALAAFVSAIGKFTYLEDPASLEQTVIDALAARVPKFFYFSSYDILPGECDLTALVEKLNPSQPLSAQERTVIALLAHAGEKPSDFMDANYDSRKAELQAASVDFSQQAFEYWKQNTDLEVVFDTDNIEWPHGGAVTHRILKIELRDGRHGGVETNFSTRSAGFQWFFSFFAAFSEYEHSSDPIIVLLDEPGTSLHGEAQKDFIRFVFGRLGSSKQTLYTTHSQFMVDPARYEKLRAVHDPATRQTPGLGVQVTPVDLSADRESILPIESALGYSISQHLFIGSGQHLAVEGSSDFIYLLRFTEHLVSQGRVGLDPRLAMIPVGGADNMPAFVAIFGRRLKVSALIDGAKTGAKIERVKAAARSNGVPESAIVACGSVDGLPVNADIEDLFTVDEYLKLYNWAFDAKLAAGDLPQTTEPILRRIELARGKFDHAIPAHRLTDRRDEFFTSVDPSTLDRFEKLFQLLNATVQD